MESLPQAMDTYSPSTPPTEPNAVGYFSVPAQGALTSPLCLPVREGSCYIFVNLITVDFFPGESAIGRDGECEVCIPVPALSRRHAILLSEEGDHFISDLDSRNCTFRGGVSGRGFVAIVSPRCLGYNK